MNGGKQTGVLRRFIGCIQALRREIRPQGLKPPCWRESNGTAEAVPSRRSRFERKKNWKMLLEAECKPALPDDGFTVGEGEFGAGRGVF
ncbi:MAG TPA: hypothetical protein VHP80_20130, partial [Candidatus Acidoferrum sp.]|nr:hypothetical protein [Candidatus Acidoferrum sp.]